MLTEKISEALSNHNKAEAKMMGALAELPNHDKSCDCLINEDNIYDYFIERDGDIEYWFCLHCGGIRDDRYD
jgi:hypothetical protein